MKTCVKRLIRVLLLLVLPTLANAQFTFTTNNGAITITGYDGPRGAVIIPSSTSGLPVTSIGTNAFDHNYNILSVEIPNSVTNIGDFAFYYCVSLTAATIPKGVITIEQFAFGYCFDLATITLPATLTTVGGGAFCDCALTDISFPSGLRSIGETAFQGCAFNTVTLPNSVTNIGDFAFAYCFDLTNVMLPDSVASIGVAPFALCTGLAAIIVDTNNPAYCSVDGILLNKSQTILLEYPEGAPNESYALPSSVLSIGDSAFWASDNLTNIAIPNSVTNIGDSAFSDCYKLGSITIPGSVVSIGYNAFYNCHVLSNVTMLSGVTKILDDAFTLCNSLTSITLPGSVTNIGNDCFYDDPNLSSVFCLGNPPNLTGEPFAGCGATVYYLPGTMSWEPTFGGRPTALWNPQVQTGSSFGVNTNQFGFTITGTANIPIVVEAATHLADGNWTALQTCTLTNGSVYVSDSQWSNSQCRFYRLRSP